MPRLAAEDIGFTWATVSRHLKDDREFATAVHEASMRVDEQVEEVLLDLALDGNMAAITKWFQGRQPGKYVDTRQVQVTGAGGGPIQLAAVSTDALRQMLTNPESRGDMLELVREIPAIEATGRETDG